MKVKILAESSQRPTAKLPNVIGVETFVLYFYLNLQYSAASLVDCDCGLDSGLRTAGFLDFDNSLRHAAPQPQTSAATLTAAADVAS